MGTNKTFNILGVANLVFTMVLTGLVAKVVLGEAPTKVETPVVVSVQAQQFDYMVDSIPDLEWTTKAQKLGQEGWELVFARRASNGDGDYAYECIFQRQSRAPEMPDVWGTHD